MQFLSAFRHTNGSEEEAAPSRSSSTRQRFLEDHLEDYRARETAEEESKEPTATSRLHLDLDAPNGEPSTFVTVINVPSPDGKKKGGFNLTRRGKQNSDSSLPPPPPLPQQSSKPQLPSQAKRASVGSMNSVSSPTTPASPRFSYAEDFNPREGMNTLDPKDPLLQGKLSSSSEETLDEYQRRDGGDEEEDDDGFLRGRPDGKDNEAAMTAATAAATAKAKEEAAAPSRSSKIRELMANWEHKGPIVGAKPTVKLERTQRKDSDSSSRGRMGSPSGKSHDSSDSENSWSNSNSGRMARSGEEMSPGTRRRISGETRLDRLVRRPSGGGGGDRHSDGVSGPPPPVLPKLGKKPMAKPRTIGHPQLQHPHHQHHHEEPLYDTVANDDPEDEYDNHLLVGGVGNRHKSDTISSSGGGSSSTTDLGFVDEAPSPHAAPHSASSSAAALKSARSGLSLTGSGTLSSSDGMGDSSSSLRRAVSVGDDDGEEEEEGNYVNIQYFLQKRQDAKTSSASAIMDTIQSDNELDDGSDKIASSSSSREILDEPHHLGAKEEDEDLTSSEVQKLVMYKCILNSIVESEAIYLEGLSVVLQYMKAMKVTMSTSQPVIPREDFDVIFYKIPELHELHYTFHESLKRQVEHRGDDGGGGGGGGKSVGGVGHTFKMLASRTKTYAAFLDNYPRALDSLHRCSASHPQFADLTRSIKLRSVRGQRQAQSLSLEDLLHKPVQRVQKLSLCLQVRVSTFGNMMILL